MKSPFTKFLLLGLAVAFLSMHASAVEEFDARRLEKKVIATGLVRPMEMAVAYDGTIYFIELDGKLKKIQANTGAITLVGELTVTTEQENGLIGLALDPNFASNGWIFLQYSPPDYPGQHISRFTLVNGQLDKSSEKRLLRYEEQRKECCHHAGSLAFGPRGELFIGTGDNTHPGGDSQGFAPIDERPERAPFDAQKSASNTRSYNGKVLRIIPQEDGTYKIPDGNLFPKDGSQGLPEIYAMGCRNPWRISVDAQTGYLYWGEVGPDAGGDGPRGPRGYDELNQARQAGNFGWPYFIANNRPYNEVDFTTGAVGEKFSLTQPINNSPNNTGSREIPPPQPAFIYYPYGKSEEFPMLGEGGRTACAGPVYHYSDSLKSENKLPQHFDRTLFFFEWSRHWIMAVHLDADSNIERIEPFMPETKFVRPIDLEVGPDGALYIIEYGETWGVNPDTQMVRIDYVRGNRAPTAIASASVSAGKTPLAVTFSSVGTSDRDSDPLTYQWRASRTYFENGNAAQEPAVILSDLGDPKLTFEKAGIYNVELIVRDSQGAESISTLPLLVGNSRPSVEFLNPRMGDFFDIEKPISYGVSVSDQEDGTSLFEQADDLGLSEIDGEAPFRVTVSATLAATPYGSSGTASEDLGPPGLRLMKKSDCFNCHAIDQVRVGPKLIDIANKYRGQDAAFEQAVTRVQKGSTGVWGKVPMIAHTQHTPEEVQEMVRWIFDLKGEGTIQVVRGFKGEVPAPTGEHATSGTVTLEANYLDLGYEGIPPLTGSTQVKLRSRRVEAELADEISGARVLDSGSAHNGKFIGAIDHGHFLKYTQIDLDSVSEWTLRVASAGAGGSIEIRQDSIDGPLLASVPVTVNGNWEAWYDLKSRCEGSGRHDLYIRFVHPEKRSGLMNLDSIYFHPK